MAERIGNREGYFDFCFFLRLTALFRKVLSIASFGTDAIAFIKRSKSRPSGSFPVTWAMSILTAFARLASTAG